MADDNEREAPHQSSGNQCGAAGAESSRAVDAARFVADVLGWGVFPVYEIERGRCSCSKAGDCPSPGKHPRTRNGVKDATTDPVVIDGWDQRWPHSNWATTPGERGVVVDIDPRKDGFTSMQQWGDLESSWSVTTGGAGRHLYFTTGEPLANRTNWLSGVDVKAAGGYVLLPGSNHVSGGSYVWDSQPPGAGPPPAPRDLLDSIRSNPGGGQGRDDLPDTDSILQGVPEGSRNDVLFKAACRWRRQLAGSREGVTVLAMHAAANCDPPYPAKEVKVCVAQAFAQEHEDVTPEQLAWAESANRMKSTSILDAMRSALLSPEDLEALPDPEWLIEGVITKSSMSVLYGSPGLGKTFLGLDWAMRIGCGLNWLGRDVAEGMVLYVYAEGVHGLKNRRAAWVESTGVLDSRVRFFPRPVPLLDEDWVRALTDLCVELQPTLVVIDTLARATAGGDENSAKDMGRAIAALDQVRDEASTAVMVVHHTGKDGMNYRGSSAIEGAADAMLHLVRRDDGSIELKNSKQKDAEAFDPIPLVLEPVGPSAVIAAGHSVQAFVDQAAGGQLLHVLTAHPETWLATATIAAEAGIKVKKTAQRRLDQMWEGGLIDRRDTGKGYQYRAKQVQSWG